MQSLLAEFFSPLRFFGGDEDVIFSHVEPVTQSREELLFSVQLVFSPK